MKKIGIVVKADPKVGQKADALEDWLHAKGVNTVRKESLPPHHGQRKDDKKQAPSDLFCIFVLGGDGTFLSAVRWIGDQKIPIMGVKFGDVGFLAETAEDRLYPVVESIISGSFLTQPRMRLMVNVTRQGRQPQGEV